jgi:dipeptidyl aminopeptidase/acylaminoacyl peptidase
MRWLGLFALASLGLVHAQARASDIRCGTLIPPRAPAAAPLRKIVAEDLVRLRDIGWPSGVALLGPDAISLSPDGSKIAFQLRQADPATNSYCLGMFTLSLHDGRLLEIDRDGDLIRETFDRTGLAAFPTGVPKLIAPRWSPDGQWIAFLKRVGDTVQVWRARSDGSEAIQVTRSASDVEDHAWSPDGTLMLFASRLGLVQAQAATETEGRSGYRFDDRFVPKAGSRPFPRATLPQQYFAVSLTTGAVRSATVSERGLLNPATDPAKIAGAMLMARGSTGRTTWTKPRDPVLFASETELRATTRSGREEVCVDKCTNIVGLWWLPGDEELMFMRREGWGLSQQGLYVWRPGKDRPRRTFVTEDLLANCQLSGRQLLCLHESSNRPRRLVMLDLDGRMRTLFDPNPEFASLRLGAVERLKWRNDRGIETFGDLVLPPNHKAGERHPLVIVQYDTRGFLRGGTGDEYPIQLFAAHGLAVVSVQRPRPVGYLYANRDSVELERNNQRDWADRKSVLSSLKRGIAIAAAKGSVDPTRVGITGLSDGTANVQYALINSNLFKAASVSSSFEGMSTLIPLAGPAGEENYVKWGYPRQSEQNSDFWRCYSLARNAARIHAPILMQLASDEYQGALEDYVALREAHIPSELYVFPDEHHIKWQPAHRLAIYRRNLAWFDFWLNETHGDATRLGEDVLTDEIARPRLPAICGE